MEYGKNKVIDFPTLEAKDIDVKIKQVSEKGAVALLYKDARVDMKLLDQVVGMTNWKSTFREIKGNLYCEVSIYDFDKKEWIGKEDCGIESREDEGNEKKGESSDAFKRACFKWGIGRELYTAPFTLLFVPTKKDERGKWILENPNERFSVQSISYDDERNIVSLTIVDSKGKVVFDKGSKAKKETKVEIKPMSEIQNNDISIAKKKSILMNYFGGLTTDKQLAFNNWLKGTYKSNDIGELTTDNIDLVLKALKIS